MLSDEEKEALEILKAVGIKCKGICIDEVIINLIEKQSKEIEELKEKIKSFTIEDKKIFLQFGEITEKKRWKDKIKAKLKELKHEKAEYEDFSEWEWFDYLTAQIEILESFLEKE